MVVWLDRAERGGHVTGHVVYLGFSVLGFVSDNVLGCLLGVWIGPWAGPWPGPGQGRDWLEI